jgi:hypothetical protein
VFVSLSVSFKTMSIYATLWSLKFPKEGDAYPGCDWVEIKAQGVPPHIGSPTPGMGYEDGDPYSGFLPPAVTTDKRGDAPFMRAVVLIKEHTPKGTERSTQEYAAPLLVLTGQEYASMTFEELYARLCNVLRGKEAPVVIRILRPDGTSRVIREDSLQVPDSHLVPAGARIPGLHVGTISASADFDAPLNLALQNTAHMKFALQKKAPGDHQ